MRKGQRVGEYINNDNQIDAKGEIEVLHKKLHDVGKYNYIP